MEFVIGAVAAVGAGFFTNPLDVIKTRMQLQGELKARGYTIHYKGFFHAFYAVAKADGLLALQKGLVPALWYQVFLNGSRLGTYDFAEKRGWTSNSRGEPTVFKCVIVGSVAGCLGAFTGSPFFLILLATKENKLSPEHKIVLSPTAHSSQCIQQRYLAEYTFKCKNDPLARLYAFNSSCDFVFIKLFKVKTHLQSQSAECVAVGYQHQHKGTLTALLNIYKEQGIVGLWRGVGSAMPRAAVGSASQLLSFAICKDYLDKLEGFAERPLLNTFVSSMVCGVYITVFMTPFDVVMTRLYNQGIDAEGKGLLYKGVLDCFIKIGKTEGIYGYFKGFVPNYIRRAPHTVLCFVFWDALRDLQNKFQEHRKTSMESLTDTWEILKIHEQLTAERQLA